MEKNDLKGGAIYFFRDPKAHSVVWPILLVALI
jgi:hypothetical protein